MADGPESHRRVVERLRMGTSVVRHAFSIDTAATTNDALRLLDGRSALLLVAEEAQVAQGWLETLQPSIGEWPTLVLLETFDPEAAAQFLRGGVEACLPCYEEVGPMLAVSLEQAIDRFQARRVAGTDHRFRRMIEQNADGLLIVDGSGRILYANGAAQQLLNRAEDDLIGSHWGLPRVTDAPVELDVPSPDGEGAVVEMRMVQLTNHGRPTYLAALRDITDLKSTERALRRLTDALEDRVAERTAQVRTLAARLSRAEQHERRRISQFLHDDVQQLLYGLGIKVKTLGRLGEDQQDAVIEDLVELVNRAIRATRTLTVDLSPPVLSGEGLEDSLRWLVNEMKEVHDLSVDLSVECDLNQLSEDLHILLFQVVRELLFNVVKHADVRHARVIAADEGEGCVIHVRDDGAGFDLDGQLEHPTPDDHFGLFSVTERMDLIGGRLEIDTAPGRGTRVSVHVPAWDVDRDVSARRGVMASTLR